MVAPSRLEVLTPRGMEANATAHRVADAIAARKGMVWAPTPEDRPATVDGAFLKDGRLHALAECKVREDRRAEIARTKWGDSLLITYEKLYRGKALAEGLAVPLVLIIYLRPDATAYVWRVSDERGRWTKHPHTEETRTQATCNGGTAYRLNAFLPFADAVPFPYPRALRNVPQNAAQQALLGL